MTTSIHVDIVLTSKLWLANENAWRVGLLNVPGSTAETPYSGGQFRNFKVERDCVFWMDARDATPSSATLHVSLPAQLRSEEEYERERKAFAAEKQQLEQAFAAEKQQLEQAFAAEKQQLEHERIAAAGRHSRRLQQTALVAALASAGVTFAVTSASGRGPSKDGGGTPTEAREC